MTRVDSLDRVPQRVPGEVWPVRTQYVAFLALAAVLACLTAIQAVASRADYDRYFGGLPPTIVVLAAGAIGLGTLAMLRSIAGFRIVAGCATGRGIAVSAGYATLLAVAIIVADVLIGYPENTNVPVPQAFLFYPTVGFVAEVVFHLVPLTLLVLALRPLRHRIGIDRVVSIAVVITAVAEPTYQILFEGERLTWASGYTWVHVGAIAFLQLRVFRRYDFASLFAFRMIYYAYWHIIWGVIRLTVLF